MPLEEVRSDNIARIKSETELADEIRAAVRPLVDEICRIMNHARGLGLTVDFQIGTDQYGRRCLVNLSIVKPL